VQEADRVTHGWALPASAPTPSSRPGTSCASTVAAPGAPGSSSKAIHVLQTAKSEDEKG